MTIQLRGDTAANWTSANPVLAVRQPGYETDTGKLKIGDGTTAWTSLAYFNPSGGSSGTVTSVAFSGGTTGLTVTGSPVTTSGTITLSGTLALANGGTGATTAAGARTALGLGTIATQNANSVSISGGTISGLSSAIPVASGGTGATTLTGYVKGSGTTALTASATIPTTDITGLATVATTGVYSDLTGRPTNVSSFTNDANYITGVAVTNDTTSATTVFPVWRTGSSSAAALVNITSSKLTFVPSTGVLTSTGFAGDGSALTSLNAGELGFSTTTRSTSYTETATTGDVVNLITGSAVNVTLPTAVGNTARLTFKLTVAGTMTLTAVGGQTIDGGTTASTSVRYTALTIVSDGANWQVI